MEPQRYFAQFEPVSVGEMPMAVARREFLVVEYDRIGVREILHDPLPLVVGQARVLTADGARVKRDMLH
ncbi:MAG: hypothetical protein ABI442_09145 [Gemmatimonadaceae bacterium]